MSKYVPKDHPAQQIPEEELERQADVLGVTPETVRVYAAEAYDAGFVRFHTFEDHFEFELTIPSGGGADE